MKKWLLSSLLLLSSNAMPSVIPIGNENNSFYYSIGGGSDFVMPPVSDTSTIRLDSVTDLGMGNSCLAINPALSIRNSINDLKNSIDNLEKSIIMSATGSLVQLPMYLLAQANPTAYNLLNNTLLAAHNQLDISIKSCETIKNQIANGQNPYQDWATISVNDQWKKHLSLVSSGREDMNSAQKDIDNHRGDAGIPWVQGKMDNDLGLHAGGKGQPPVHVIADTVKAGYNALLNRDLQSDDNAPDTHANASLRKYFFNPKAAVGWITNVTGDQIITTATDNVSRKAQGSLVGHGLIPWITSCQNNKENCSDTIRDELVKLVSGNETITKTNLEKVSADELAMSPEVIASIRRMDPTQQVMIINKLSQEIATQRVIDKTFVAQNILMTGAQVPAISSNHPAQVIIGQAMANLDNEIKSLVFESQIRKQTMSSTISEVLNYAKQQQLNSMNAPASSSPIMMQDSAIPVSKEK